MDVVKSIILVILTTAKTSEHNLTVLATWFCICLYQWRMVSTEIGEDKEIFTVNKSKIKCYSNTQDMYSSYAR